MKQIQSIHFRLIAKHTRNDTTSQSALIPAAVFTMHLADELPGGPLTEEIQHSLVDAAMLRQMAESMLSTADRLDMMGEMLTQERPIQHEEAIHRAMGIIEARKRIEQMETSIHAGEDGFERLEKLQLSTAHDVKLLAKHGWSVDLLKPQIDQCEADAKPCPCCAPPELGEPPQAREPDAAELGLPVPDPLPEDDPKI